MIPPAMSPSRLALAAALGAVAAWATPAMGQRRTVTAGLGAGATVPIGTFADDVKGGFHGLAFVQYEPGGNLWGVRGEAQYHRAEYTDGFRDDVGATPDDDLTNGVLYVGSAAVLAGSRKARRVAPYMVGGLGLYRITATRGGTVSTSVSENGFGFNVGAGLRMGAGTGFYCEVRFHQFSITPDSADKTTYRMIPLSVGVRF